MMLRSFIAIEMPAEIQAAIAEQTAALKKDLPKPLVRWVAPQNVHLTLKFLGDISPANLEHLSDSLKADVGHHEGFTLKVGGLGVFPNPRRPRVIWIGLDAPPALLTLQHGIEAAAARLGYASEERAFTPHLTLGRVGQNISTEDLQRIRSALEITHVSALGSVRVDAVHIFKSDLQPGGPIYTHMVAMPLKNG